MARWRGIIAFTGYETGDHRIIDSPVTARGLPLTMRAVFVDGWGGHENAEPVGTIDLVEELSVAEVQERGLTLEVELPDGATAIYSEGAILAGDPSGERWENMLGQGAMRGVSIDPTAVDVTNEVVLVESGEVIDLSEMTWEEIDVLLFEELDQGDWYWRERYSNLEIGALTSVGTSAFNGTVVELVADDTGSGEGEPVAASAAPGFAENGSISVGDVVWWTGDDDEREEGEVIEVDVDEESVTVESGEVLPVSTVTLVDTDESDEDGGDDEMTVRRPALAALLARETSTRSALVASSILTPSRPGGAVVTASVAWDEGPPAEWFEQLDLDGPTPFTITDDGEVFGHVATWGTCHTGFAGGIADDCVMPTPSPTGYALFHANRQVRTADGERVSVGIISLDTGHASAGRPGARPSVSSVISHYDNTGTGAMTVRAYDDDHGIQVHGALAAGISIEQVRRAMAAAPSGDWRDHGQGLDMLGLLMVNFPGFPVYSKENGKTVALVASLSPGLLRGRQAATDTGSGCGGGCSSCSCTTGSAGSGEERSGSTETTGGGLGERIRRSERLRLISSDRAMAGLGPSSV